MLVYRTFRELKLFLGEQVGKGLTVGFVPTMGALHNGHMSLIEESNKLSDITLCSIFVNPTQFNVPEDLDKYPRTESKDLALLQKNNCDVVFIPSVEEVYPKNYATPKVDLGGVKLMMEGKHRPGHFNGVVQVVGRFFEEIQPNFSFFGEKDFQQLAVIRKMVVERSFETKIVACKIMREDSGLAMSSRNVRLSKEGLLNAQFISEQLNWARSNYYNTSIDDIQKIITDRFSRNAYLELEYFEIVNETTLLPIKSIDEKARAFVAADLEGVRLIDNLELSKTVA